MVLHLDEVHVAGLVEAQLVGLIEQSRCGGPAVAGVAFGSTTGDRREQMRFQIEPANAMIADLTEVERAIRSDHQTIGIVDLAFHARSAIAGESSGAGTGEGGDCLGSRAENQRKKEEQES